jgi:hypothetical protein
MRKSTLVLSCVSVATTMAAFWFWQQWQDERPVRVDAKEPIANLECQAAPATGITATPDSTPSAVPAAKRMSATNAAMPTLAPEFAPPPEPRLLKDPEFRAALRSQQRVMLEEEFRDLPKILGLSAEQSDRLFDLLAEQRTRVLEARWQKPEGGKTPTSSFQEARAKNKEELANFLGPSNMIRYEDFLSTRESRAEINSVRNELARGTEPLREEQIEPMMAVVNAELQRLDQEVRDVGPQELPGSDPTADAKRVELTVAANQRILDAARTILSSAQLSGLKDLYRRQRLQMESEGTLNRMRSAAAAGSAPK